MYNRISFMRGISIFISSLLVGFIVFVLYNIIKPNNSNHAQTINPLSSTPTITTNFSIANPPSASMRGTIATMSGSVSFSSRIATQSSPLTNSTTQIEQGESLQTNDHGYIKVDFKQLGKLTVFHNSSLNIIQLLPYSSVFSQDNGTVNYDVTNTNPLAIRSMDLLIQIDKPAILSVNVDTTNNLVNVSMSSGSATLGYDDLNYVSHVSTLNSNDKVSFDDTQRQINPD